MKKLIRMLTKGKWIENQLIKYSSGQNDENIFVKILPRHFQYSDQDIRIIERKNIKYEVSLNNYNDWILYFDINNQHKENIYQNIENGDIILDVGSNIGEVLLNMAKVNPAGKIYGFEPVNSTFQKLFKNVSLNEFQNIMISRLALSDKNETVYYQEKAGHSGGTMMSKETGKNQTQFIEALTLDEFVKTHGLEKIDFIKVDIEGFEMNFVNGAIETLKNFKPLLFMEVDQNKLKRQQTSASALLEKLFSLNYQIFYAETRKEILSTDLTEKHFDILCVAR